MNALISRLQAPRTIRSHVLRLLVVRTLGSVVLIALVLVGQSMVIQPSRAELDALPGMAPRWSILEQSAYPGCVRVDDWPPNTWGSAVVAYNPEQGRTTRVDFDRAWEINHNESESDDLKVLGICS